MLNTKNHFRILVLIASFFLLTLSFGCKRQKITMTVETPTLERGEKCTINWILTEKLEKKKINGGIQIFKNGEFVKFPIEKDQMENKEVSFSIPYEMAIGTYQIKLTSDYDGELIESNIGQIEVVNPKLYEADTHLRNFLVLSDSTFNFIEPKNYINTVFTFKNGYDLITAKPKIKIDGSNDLYFMGEIDDYLFYAFWNVWGDLSNRKERVDKITINVAILKTRSDKDKKHQAIDTLESGTKLVFLGFEDFEVNGKTKKFYLFRNFLDVDKIFAPLDKSKSLIKYKDYL